MVRRKQKKRGYSEIDRGPLGAAIFQTRKQRRLTQMELANRLGRNRPWVSNVETGKVKILNEEDLVGLSAVLRISISSLRAAHDLTAATQVVSVPGYTILQSNRNCLNCHHVVEPDASFCTHCGSGQPMQINCPACARPNNPGARFCARCGSQLQG